MSRSSKNISPLLLLFALAVAASLAVGAAMSDSAQAARQVKVGVHITDPAQLGSFEYQTDRSVEVYSYYHAINDSFYAAGLRPVAASGHMVMLSWEPWDRNHHDPVNQPAYRLRNITAGYYDDQIRRWARDLRDFQYPILLRPMSEMNGNWTSWSGTVNGNSPADFAPAWRRIHDIFEQEGATNVSWVWTPNRDGSTAAAVSTFDLYYPGDRFVDYIGLSGYNWGTMYNTPSWISSWQSFEQVFGNSYDVMTSRTDKPVIITETASTELGGNKSQWITDTFNMLPTRFPRIRIITWFNISKETDWRVQSSSASLLAFRQQMWKLGPADLASNYGSLCPRPAMAPAWGLRTYWANYNDYSARRLSVDYEFRNFGAIDAYNLKLLGSVCTNGARLVTPTPYWVGAVPAFQKGYFTLQYYVPDGIASFWSINYITGENGCGNEFLYPNFY
ncbi:MAG: glycoside hydrolase family 26 protein [Thermoleophilia bacterium]